MLLQEREKRRSLKAWLKVDRAHPSSIGWMQHLYHDPESRRQLDPRTLSYQLGREGGENDSATIQLETWGGKGGGLNLSFYRRDGKKR